MNKWKPGFGKTAEHGDKLRLTSNERPALFIAMSVHSLPGSSTSTSLSLSKLLFQKVLTSYSLGHKTLTDQKAIGGILPTA